MGIKASVIAAQAGIYHSERRIMDGICFGRVDIALVAETVSHTGAFLAS